MNNNTNNQDDGLKLVFALSHLLAVDEYADDYRVTRTIEYLRDSGVRARDVAPRSDRRRIKTAAKFLSEVLPPGGDRNRLVGGLIQLFDDTKGELPNEVLVRAALHALGSDPMKWLEWCPSTDADHVAENAGFVHGFAAALQMEPEALLARLGYEESEG